MNVDLSHESADWAAGLGEEKLARIRELHRLRPARNAMSLVFVAIWAAAGWAVLNVPAWPVRVAGIFLIGASIHALAILMHEAVHGNLFRREPLDRWVGFVLGAPALVSCMAYRVNHLLHHAFNRTARDPDEFTNLTGKRRLLSAAFYVWPLVGMPAYLIHVPLSALRRGTRRQRAVVILELVLIAGMVAGAFVGASRLGGMRGLLLCWVLPVAAAAILGGFRSWAEHMMTQPGHPLTQSRCVTSNRLVSFFLCNLNYHLEHHLYPAVPWYNLPDLHRLLREDFRRAGSPICRSYLRFLWDAVRAGIHGRVPATVGELREGRTL